MLACDACDSGVPRSHLISYALDGGLLKELYTHDGIGTLISPDEYEQIKGAEAHDLAGILELIRPLQQAGVLADRSNEEIERSLDKFTVITKDSRVIACAALLDNPADNIAEIASVATIQITGTRDTVNGSWQRSLTLPNKPSLSAFMYVQHKPVTGFRSLASHCHHPKRCPNPRNKKPK